MLVYIRDCDREEIMREVPIQEIPPHLKSRFDEENYINQKLEEDQAYNSECGTVFIVTWDIIKEWSDFGFMQSTHDIYFGPKFSENHEQRLMLKCDKKEKIIDLLTRLRKKRKLGILPKDLNIYRLAYQGKQQCYYFYPIGHEDFNTDIFVKSQQNRPQIFFFCNKRDPSEPILSRYT